MNDLRKKEGGSHQGYQLSTVSNLARGTMYFELQGRRTDNSTAHVNDNGCWPVCYIVSGLVSCLVRTLRTAITLLSCVACETLLLTNCASDCSVGNGQETRRHSSMKLRTSIVVCG